MLVLLILLFLASHTPVRVMPAHERMQDQQPSAALKFEMRELTDEEAAALVPGEGRDAVAFMCVPCHGVLRAISERKTAPGWAATVDSMREKGAKGSDDQAAAVVTYLSAHFAAVDVNTATADELIKVAGLSAEDAAAIVAYRGDGRPFKSYADLKKVSGIDPKRLAAAKPRLVYAPK